MTRVQSLALTDIRDEPLQAFSLRKSSSQLPALEIACKRDWDNLIPGV